MLGRLLKIFIVKQIGGLAPLFCPIAPVFVGSHPIFSHTSYLGVAMRNGPRCCVLVGAVSYFSVESSCGGSCGGGGCHGYYCNDTSDKFKPTLIDYRLDITFS